MRTLPAALTAQAEAAAQAPTLLAELSGWGGATVRWANSDADVTYAGDLYDARPFTLGQVEWDAAGRAQALTLGVANQDLAPSTLIDTATPVGALLTVYRVFLDDLTVAETLAAGLTVRSFRLGDDAAELACEGLGTLLRRPLPARVLGRSCPWQFKGSHCGYAGAETECDHTAEDCDTTMANFANFGGFLHVLPRGVGGV